MENVAWLIFGYLGMSAVQTVAGYHSKVEDMREKNRAAALASNDLRNDMELLKSEAAQATKDLCKDMQLLEDNLTSSMSVLESDMKVVLESTMTSSLKLLEGDPKACIQRLDHKVQLLVDKQADRLTQLTQQQPAPPRSLTQSY